MAPPHGSILLESGKHRLFGPFCDLFTILGALSYAISHLANGHSKVGNAICESTQLPRTTVTLHCGDVLSAPIHNKDIHSIRLTIGTRAWSEGPVYSGYQSATHRLIVPIFVEYYEDNRPWLEAWVERTSSPRPKHLFLAFPAVWQFARVIRNGLSHGGSRIPISDPAFAPVTWHALTYGPSDDGRRFLGSDLSIADLVLLMLEMAEALDNLGCPA